MSGGDLDGFLSPFLRRRRISVAKPYLRGRVLDFGCGNADVCALVGQENYVGVDLDEAILKQSRKRYPRAVFLLPPEFETYAAGSFDTVSALAIIEHLDDPSGFLKSMRRHLAPNGRIVLTTPNPSLDWAHGVGAKFGIFAKESHDEHQSLMNRDGIVKAAGAAGLKLTVFRRFLGGANQLAVLTA
jgi:SAM-dependent methyltransferase